MSCATFSLFLLFFSFLDAANIIHPFMGFG